MSNVDLFVLKRIERYLQQFVPVFIPEGEVFKLRAEWDGASGRPVLVGYNKKSIQNMVVVEMECKKGEPVSFKVV